MSEWSVFVGNAVVIDKVVFNSWLMGRSVEQAIAQYEEVRSSPLNLPMRRNYVVSQYRNYELLENYLHQPQVFMGQLLFPLPPHTKQYLITSYYNFDARVVREFLGKKLTSRARKELDEVCHKTRVPLGGCKRMFDNLKRIIKRVEDVDGDIVRIIQNHFCLPKELASSINSQYAHVIFITNYRFDTSKKKLAYLSFSDFEYVASKFIQYLTVSGSAGLEELDLSLAQDARDLKAVIFNHKEIMEDYRQAVTIDLAATGHGAIMDRAGQAAFKVVLRNILSIVSGLSHSKDQRDLFVSIVEKVVEPSVSIGWNSSDLGLFLDSVVRNFSSIESVNHHFRKKLEQNYGRLIFAIKFAAMRFMK
ncbi:hypothetical protein HK102_009542 [Quaeritorhiza haematococci]|nr:hypothetical protein HK102_009542 [Quaeritorhiza haematococci]